MSRAFSIFLAGLLFGAGLAIAGMTDPARVLAFLDVTGAWNRSLLFVLGGAVGVFVVSFRLITRQGKPLLAERFHLPAATDIDAPLVLGSVLFGIGWGISGYCPGPAVALLAVANNETWLFLPALVAGALLYRLQQHVGRTPDKPLALKL